MDRIRRRSPGPNAGPNRPPIQAPTRPAAAPPPTPPQAAAARSRAKPAAARPALAPGRLNGFLGMLALGAAGLLALILIGRMPAAAPAPERPAPQRAAVEHRLPAPAAAVPVAHAAVLRPPPRIAVPSLAPAPASLATAMPPPPEPPPAALPVALRPPPPLPATPAPSARPGGARVAIVIDDMGLDRPRSARALALPGALTYAFLPYAPDLAGQRAATRRRGGEIMLHLPMEPMNLSGNNPGPNALLVSLSDAEIERRVEAALAAVPDAVAVNNHMGSRFTASAGDMAAVMRVLKRRGVAFLDSRTTGASVAERSAQQAGLRHAGRDVFLDDDQSPAAIARQLERLETIARRHGSAIAIGHPHDATIAALQVWLPRARAAGITVVPLSALLRE